MRNRYLLAMGLLLLGVFASCSKWLDVKPKTEIKSEVLFETEQGFKDALIGCYILLSEPALYGKEMTIGFMDVIGQQYEFNGSTSSTYYNLASYRYDSYRSYIDAMWLKLYNAIANINNIIENLETNRDILPPMTYSLIKGEAYGLRAYLHFDLIRMFSWGNLQKQPDKLNRPAIPYVTLYDKAITKQHTLKEVIDNISRDIAVAKEMLQYYDPASSGVVRPDDYIDYGETEPFFSLKDRKYRLNYNAARMLEMRMLMWQGGSENEQIALTIGDQLITQNQIPWITDNAINNSDPNYRDLSFVAEQVFGVETFNRFENVIKPYFKLTVLDNVNMNYQCLFHTKSRADLLFEIASNVGVSDYRYTRLYNKDDAKFEILKFWEYERTIAEYKNNMPLMKKAEIYYMAAECANNVGDAEKAVGYLNQVRVARGISSTLNLPSSLSQEDIKKEIEKEWKKEFISEGQMFFFYKRLGYVNIPGSNTPGDDKLYLFPFPDNEVEEGRIDPNKKDESTNI